MVKGRASVQGTGPSGAATLGSHCSALRTTTFFRVECPLPRGAGTGHASRVQRRTRLHATPAHTAAHMEGGFGQIRIVSAVHTHTARSRAGCVPTPLYPRVRLSSPNAPHPQSTHTRLDQPRLKRSIPSVADSSSEKPMKMATSAAAPDTRLMVLAPPRSLASASELTPKKHVYDAIASTVPTCCHQIITHAHTHTPTISLVVLLLRSSSNMDPKRAR